ncbi:GNAT family N-acetyltransferase [Salipiger sp. 1_MG-2023]|uniref:GNAT family N-acetyltransferase n=1 Tax=Salipiger sp. 1_MG-2023 TaxID=3062665 RepID=UPI0026E37411|nr:GNAT family N-acetyltransferase [Salipiger sp. 1_MG-2023]MDO6585664.1 GNAT family N-acetyltransferase [Salipiger sp. 1_MG-2023]
MIRPAREADEAAIRDCARQAYGGYVPLIGREPAPMSADYAAQIAAGEVFVAEDGGFLGFIVYRMAPDHLLLENVAVLPRASGRGIGKALIAACEDAARAAGLPVRLYTNAKMTANLSLYPRLGYTETGRVSEDGFDRVYFEKQP